MVVHSNLYYLGTWLVPLMCIAATFMPKVRRAKPAQTETKTESKEKVSPEGSSKFEEDDKNVIGSTEISDSETKKVQ